MMAMTSVIQKTVWSATPMAAPDGRGERDSDRRSAHEAADDGDGGDDRHQDRRPAAVTSRRHSGIDARADEVLRPVAVARGEEARVAELDQGRALGGVGGQVALGRSSLDGVGDQGPDLGLQVGAL